MELDFFCDLAIGFFPHVLDLQFQNANALRHTHTTYAMSRVHVRACPVRSRASRGLKAQPDQSHSCRRASHSLTSSRLRLRPGGGSRVVSRASESDGDRAATSQPLPTNGKVNAVRHASDASVRELAVKAIRRPLHGARPGGYDQDKIAWLASSIAEVGLLEPIDVLEVDMEDGTTAYYGFSGCHRYEAHVRLGKETILCRVRKATKATLRIHLR